MAILANRARMTTATAGTGTITLGSAVAGYQSFADAGVTNGQSVSYVIEDGVNWELGRGTYTTSGTTLSRTPLESNNADAAISLSGSAQVFISALKEDVQQAASETEAGIAEYATAAEVNSATASRIATPERVKDAMAWFAMTHNASQAIDCNNGPNQKVTLAANTTFGAPSSAKPGYPLNLWLVQDGTGSRTGSWNAAFDFGDVSAPTLTTTAGDGDVVTFLCLTTGKYAYLGIRKSVGA